MRTKWTIDPNQSDVLINMRHSIIAYPAGSKNEFNEHIDRQNDKIQDTFIEFTLNINTKYTKLKKTDTQLSLNDLIDIRNNPIISFKSTSFEKINKNINFLKGNLTIKNITKVMELDAEFIGIHTYNGDQKTAFEITGEIKRKDFGLHFN